MLTRLDLRLRAGVWWRGGEGGPRGLASSASGRRSRLSPTPLRVEGGRADTADLRRGLEVRAGGEMAVLDEDLLSALDAVRLSVP